ncbi:MAG: hypothetical protein OEV99_17090 [Nitrospira sp.]|nr:hypothetical protein [Nitrospira sp.]MDH4371537.1 hypothetical protein [Nitrospira sp.]
MAISVLESSPSAFMINPEATFRSEEIQNEGISSEPYARCIAASQRVRWDIEKDVIRGRSFDSQHKFLPDALSKVQELEFLTPDSRRYLSQIQGRTYANMFHMAERFVNAKVLEISRDYWLGNQTALEALVGFSQEELKHQRMFRRLEELAGEHMSPGYSFLPNPDEVATIVLSKSTWAVLALTHHLELVSQLHYRQSIGRDENVSPLYKDVFQYHWLEESQHAIMDELEWGRLDKQMSWEAKDRAVDEFIELVNAVDGILQVQAEADGEYFARTCGHPLRGGQPQALKKGILKAYRWQHILSGAQHPKVIKVLTSFVTERQSERIQEAMAHVSHGSL